MTSPTKISPPKMSPPQMSTPQMSTPQLSPPQRAAATRRVVFVYNANSDLLEVIRHVLHAALRPSTYPCRLCLLSYGATGMRKGWRRFVRDLETRPETGAVEHLHIDELVRAHGDPGDPKPCLYERWGDGPLELVVSAAQMNTTHTLDELVSLCDGALRASTVARSSAAASTEVAA